MRVQSWLLAVPAKLASSSLVMPQRRSQCISGSASFSLHCKRLRTSSQKQYTYSCALRTQTAKPKLSQLHISTSSCRVYAASKEVRSNKLHLLAPREDSIYHRGFLYSLESLVTELDITASKSASLSVQALFALALKGWVLYQCIHTDVQVVLDVVWLNIRALVLPFDHLQQ
eukprot:9804-Heterococcus_DN1.PRE.1